jgi:DNA replication protein DnaC
VSRRSPRYGLTADSFRWARCRRTARTAVSLTSNKAIRRWGEVFGDDSVAAATIDRLVHHAEIIALKGDSYRLKNRDLGRVPATASDS